MFGTLLVHKLNTRPCWVELKEKVTIKGKVKIETRFSDFWISIFVDNHDIIIHEDITKTSLGLKTWISAAFFLKNNGYYFKIIFLHHL